MVNLTPIVRLASISRRQQLANQNCIASQESVLLQLVQAAKGTKFGRDHNFGEIRSVSDFQARVPLRRYEQFWGEYWQPAFPHLVDCSWPGQIPFFAVSSGTSSGTTKYIPCSHEMVKSNNKAGTDLLFYHLWARPQSKLFGGRSLVLGGSTELVEEAPGVFSGDLSGIATICLPWWAKPFYFPDRETSLLKNWEEKIARFVRALNELDIRSVSGVPSWMVILFERALKESAVSEKKLGSLLPNLELIIHGGVNFNPYRSQFAQLLEGSQAELREVYPASEGFIAIADRGPGEGLRLVLDHGVFFEFVPVEELDNERPTRHWVSNLEIGVNYAVVLSTCAGLWSYVLGDTVRLIDRDPPRLLITGRTSYMMSAFGEHLIGEEIEDAVTKAAEEIGVIVKDYSMGAVYPDESNPLGGHRYIVEFQGEYPQDAQLERFIAQIDRVLCVRNEDYQAHRAEGFGMRRPEVVAVREGTFAGWMKKRGKLGGQHKVPRIINDQGLFADLQSFIS